MAKVVRKENESVESLIKRFKKAVANDGTMEELRKREYYVGPSLKRKLKSKEAQKRARKYQQKKKHIDSGYDY